MNKNIQNLKQKFGEGAVLYYTVLESFKLNPPKTGHFSIKNNIENVLNNKPIGLNIPNEFIKELAYNVN